MIWVPVNNFPIYEVSEYGDVRNVITGNIKSSVENEKGYLKVLLCYMQKKVNKRIHILVAEHFIGERLPGYEVNHKDRNKKNNHYSNLEWCTHKENMQHYSHTNKLISLGL